MASQEEIARRVVSYVGTGSILLSSGRYQTEADMEAARNKFKGVTWSVSHPKQ